MCLTEQILRNNYTIYISKEKGNPHLKGTYLKKNNDGIHVFELPQEEMKHISHLHDIMELLEDGGKLQINMPDFSIHAIIGKEKTEGPYCETQYFEVADESNGTDYYSTLIELNMNLASNKRIDCKKDTKQYKKLYKGVDCYQ